MENLNKEKVSFIEYSGKFGQSFNRSYFYQPRVPATSSAVAPVTAKIVYSSGLCPALN